jgi:hypothetical protein
MKFNSEFDWTAQTTNLYEGFDLFLDIFQIMYRLKSIPEESYRHYEMTILLCIFPHYMLFLTW